MSSETISYGIIGFVAIAMAFVTICKGITSCRSMCFQCQREVKSSTALSNAQTPQVELSNSPAVMAGNLISQLLNQSLQSERSGVRAQPAEGPSNLLNPQSQLTQSQTSPGETNLQQESQEAYRPAHQHLPV